MFKKLLAMSLSVILLLGITPTAFATDRTDTATNFKADSSESITVDELIEHLNSIDFGREVTFTSLPQSRSSDQELIHFDSVEAVEAYLNNLLTNKENLPYLLKQLYKILVHSAVQNRLQEPTLAGTILLYGGGVAETPVLHH